MKIISVVGARPNFMKIAPFIKAIDESNEDCKKRYEGRGMRYALTDMPPFSEETNPETLNPELSTLSPGHIDHILVHTGQHYDDRMSEQFFKDLGIPRADINLGIGSGTHAEQVGQTMIAFEKVLKAEKPDWVVVVGDVNATLACSVTAKKENIKCCHIEAGLRSGDMSMPEEINRLVTDRLSDLLLAPDRFSVNNLKAEGVTDSRIRFVGNIMIDTLETNRLKASELDVSKIIEENFFKRTHDAGYTTQGLNRAPHTADRTPDDYCLVTIHRPSNVDTKDTLSSLADFLTGEVSSQLPVIWPIHPRTARNLIDFGLLEKIRSTQGIFLLEPIGYLEMLRLNMGARVMLTDSGGLQEECTVLGTPFITLRMNTERPVTLSGNGGTGVLAGNDLDLIRREFHSALDKPRNPVRPELWDGHAAERCLEAILDADAAEGSKLNKDKR